MTRCAYVDSCKVRPAMLADGVGGNGSVAPPGSFGATTQPVESTSLFPVAPDMAAPLLEAVRGSRRRGQPSSRRPECTPTACLRHRRPADVTSRTRIVAAKHNQARHIVNTWLTSRRVRPSIAAVIPPGRRADLFVLQQMRAYITRQARNTQFRSSR